MSAGLVVQRLALGFVFGIVSFSFFGMLGALAFSCATVVFGLAKKNIFYATVILFGVAMGVARYEAAQAAYESNPLVILARYEKEAVLIGTISSEPDTKDSHSSLEVSVDTIVSGGKKQAQKGKIIAIVPTFPEYRHGTRVLLSGVLSEPGMIEDFNYRDFLKKENVHATMLRPEINVLLENQTNLFYAFIFRLKESLYSSLKKAVPYPQESLISAMLLGYKHGIPEQISENFSRSGLSHITAISGMHIVIVAGILIYALNAIGANNRAKTLVVVITLSAFVVMVGSPPSAIRASVMASAVLFARTAGRLTNTYALLLFAALAMMVPNPFLARLDVGFQLSFMATFGIVYASQLFGRWLGKLPRALGILLSVSLAAQVFTMPLLIYYFGYVSIFSAVANIFVVPLLPLVMVLGTATAISGTIMPLLAALFGMPLWFILSYIVWVADFFSAFPVLSAKQLPLWSVFVIYGVLLFLFYRARRKAFFNHGETGDLFPL